jgi:ribulose-phosphate 3-epimerase
MLDVHLMIERPERQVSEFIKAGAHSITVHAESTPQLAYAVHLIRDSGACVGVAINPATPVGVLAEITDAIDMALCMTINPGWGGQRFIEHSLEKLPRVRAILSEDVAVEVDGGINPTTAPKCRQAGANVFVAGSAIFSSADPGEAYLAIARSLQTD